ncbi:MAG: type III polyketide synthase [Leptospiraceae bacterium]|nr:hypothetical protein [Leptospiraceae bacterium]MCP5498634.1 type III polyketide synthase [Leptospiraceae bacterium]
MAFIHSIASSVPAQILKQEEIKNFSSRVFDPGNRLYPGLIKVFDTAQIENRPVLENLNWYETGHSFKEKNELFLSHALSLAQLAGEKALQEASLKPEEIEILLVVTSSGFVTPSLDARLMDLLGLKEDCIRLPITGLGCAGGAYGLSRARDFAKAYPGKKILLIAVETCTLTFRPGDKRKANYIALSLFSDGAAATIISSEPKINSIELQSSYSYKWRDSLNVMGWDVEDDGLQVIFDKSIPFLIMENYGEIMDAFFNREKLSFSDIQHFLFHPGGAKVIDAFSSVLKIERERFYYTIEILRKYGNMSSPTLLFVIEEFLKDGKFSKGEEGLMTAMGPGFSCEALLFKTS